MIGGTALRLLRFLGAQPGTFESTVLGRLKSPPWEDTIANNITMARARVGVWGINIFYWASLLPRMQGLIWGTIAALIIGAALDSVDGLVARRCRCETAFGRFIDPLADKAIAWSTFGVLAQHYRSLFVLTPIGIIMFYDVMVSRARMRDEKMRTNRIAKLKQWPLDIGIIILVFAILLDRSVVPYIAADRSAYLYRSAELSGQVLLLLAMVLAIISAAIYHQHLLRWHYYRYAPGIQKIMSLFL